MLLSNSRLIKNARSFSILCATPYSEAAFYFSLDGSKTAFWIIKFTIDMMTDTRMAVPKPAISNESPMKPSVIINVIALITNRNRPSVRTVTGSVNMMRMGFTRMFKIDSMKLAPMAAPNPDR